MKRFLILLVVPAWAVAQGLNGASAGQFRIIERWPSGNAKSVKVSGIVPNLSAGNTATVTLTGIGGASVPLTVQEALYPSGPTTGVARTNEPFVVGLPIADSLGLTSVSGLALTGTTSVPNSNLATDNGATITVATGTCTFTIKKANFNGLDSVVCGSTTLVSTSTSATRGLVVVGPDPTATYPANVTCSPQSGGSTCATVYSSANDPNSTCSIDNGDNGPVMAVIKCVGSHIDSASHPYMQYTLWMTFYYGKGTVNARAILRNANYDCAGNPTCSGTSHSPDFTGTFNTAHKGMRSYELRIGTTNTAVNFTIATNSGQQTGSLSGGETAFIYQGQSNTGVSNSDCPYGSACANLLTTDIGWTIKKNSTVLASGTQTTCPRGWADMDDGAGNGVEIGMYQMCPSYPVSLEFFGTGSELRVGLFSAQNTINFYQAWPYWDTKDVLLNFHTSAPSSLNNSFQAYQAYLVARADRMYYNSTNFFLNQMPSAAQEDTFYTATQSAANPSFFYTLCCIADTTPEFYGQWFNWDRGGGGPFVQQDQRFNNLQIWIKRGHTGRYLDATHFFRLNTSHSWEHSDGKTASPSADHTVNGFLWSSRPQFGQTNSELQGLSMVTASSVNGAYTPFSTFGGGGPLKFDYNHPHYHGIFDYYGLTGDESIKDGVIAMKEFYLDRHSYAWNSFNLTSIRAQGILMLDASKFGEFLASIGDPDASNVTAMAEHVYTSQVQPDVCVTDGTNNYPAGCTLPPASGYGPGDSSGVSRVRGLPLQTAGSRGGDTWCGLGSGPGYRETQQFMNAILVNGLTQLQRAKGSSWTYYREAGDLAFGISQYSIDDAFNWNGSSKWLDLPNDNPNCHGTNCHSLNNGVAYFVWTDTPQTCPNTNGYLLSDGHYYDGLGITYPMQTQFNLWANMANVLGTLPASEVTKFKIALQKNADNNLLQNNFDIGGYATGEVIKSLAEPSGLSLTSITPSISETSPGSGTYNVSWTTPPGATGTIRVKYSTTKQIVDWLGYNKFTQTWAYNPGTYVPWFAANTTADTAAVPGSQSMQIATGKTGLTAANFSVKAYVSGGATTAPPSTPTTLIMVSGNNQTGAVGQALANALIVRVTDGSGNSSAGVAVTFTVTTGGGSLSTTSTVTNSSGVASAMLTLGSTAGANTVVASSGTLAGSPISFTATGTAAVQTPANLVLVSGNSQTGAPGQALSSPFTVKVTAANGTVVAGVTVTFTVTVGGGSLSTASAVTNSSGLASTTLTLGSAAGINTVTAASGTLAGSPMAFSATGTSGGGATITWVQQPHTSGWPNFNGYLAIRYDTVSRRTIVYGVPKGSNSIYSTSLNFYDGANNTFVTLSSPLGTSLTASCPANTPEWPSSRHPYAQLAVDSSRNRLWLYGGANQACGGSTVNISGTSVTWQCCGLNLFSTDGSWTGASVAIGSSTYTVASVTDSTHLQLTASAGTQTGVSLQLTGNSAGGMYYLRLNTDPLTDTWQQVFPAKMPNPISVASALVYDPDDDVLFAFGTDGSSQTHNNWVYCPTDRNATVGALTTKQSAAGCTSADNWSEVAVVGGVRPPGVAQPDLVYDTVTKKVIQYGGSWGDNTPRNQTWAYDVPTRKWTQKALSTTPPPLWAGSVAGAYSAQPGMAYNPNTHKILYHQTSGVGAPADWEYDPVADTWTRLTATGGGPSGPDATVAYDLANNKLITWSYLPGTPDVWQGTLSTTTTPRGACDLNADGVVNKADVDNAISQVLTPGSCGTADLIGNGGCNVIDVQRVINASMGGSCRTGQ